MNARLSSEQPYIDRAKAGRHSWWRYLFTASLAILFEVGALFPLIVLAIRQGRAADKFVLELNNPADPVLFFSFVALSFGGLMLGVLVGGMLLHKKSIGDYIGRFRWRLFLFGIFTWLGLVMADSLVDYSLEPSGFHYNGFHQTWTVVALTGVALAIQTFAEEVIFRGWLNQGIAALIGRPFATAIVSGLVFGAFHLSNGPWQAASATIMGIALSLIAMRTGGLALGYGIHLINNLYAALVVVLGNDVFKGLPGIVTANTPELEWVDLGVLTVGLGLIVWRVYRMDGRGSD